MASVGETLASCNHDRGVDDHAAGTSSAGSRASPRDKASNIYLSGYGVCLMIILLFVATSSKPISAQTNFTISGAYNCSSNMICLGSARQAIENETQGFQDGSLSLTPADSPNVSGVAYYRPAVRLLDPSTHRSASFNTSFVMDVVTASESHGDGMAFVICADKQAVGSGGPYFGIFQEETGNTSFKAIVIEFDGYQNPGPPENDINGNHVSFDFSSITFSAAANVSDVNVSLWYNLTTYAWVEYRSETQQLEVRVSNNNSRPTSPLLNYTVNLFDVAEEKMWVGFSAGKTNSGSRYYVDQWAFESYWNHPPKKSGNKVALIVGICLGIPFLLSVACIIDVVFVHRRSDDSQGRCRSCWLGWMESKSEEVTVQLEGMPERFSYRLLSDATRGFSDELKLGQGGFGSVYRGVLPTSGVSIAVKKIKSDSTQGEKEFMTEVSIISQLSHRNLIQLQGWCTDAVKEKYLLVYELMPNGSLDKALFLPSKQDSCQVCLSWAQRFNIVTGIAAALDYLHQGWKRQVIHRDIKSSNIMLDGQWDAKLGDFGLARLTDHQRTAATTEMAGTYGYIAPEAATSGRFTDKSDVFAFGAVVLEVACGRPAFLAQVPSQEMVLVDWVWDRLREGDLLTTVDKRLEDYDSYRMEVMLVVGLLCSHPNPLTRPSMRQVVQVLSGDAPVPSIPVLKPALVFSSDPQAMSMDDLYHPKAGAPPTPTSEPISFTLSRSFAESTGASTVKSTSFDSSFSRER